MSWKTMKLGDACTIEKGNIGIMKAIPGEYPLIVLGDERRSHNEYQFDDDAVIIPLVSSTGHGHRSMKRIHFQAGKFAVGNILCAVIPKDKTVLSAQFLYRYLDLNREKELVSRMRGMANVSLSVKSIADVEIPIPPIEIQQEIIKRFDKVEKSNGELLSEHNYQLDFLKKLRQQILQDAVQGKIVPQDPNDEPASKLLERIKDEKEKLIQEKKIKKDKPIPEIKPDEIPFEIPENWVWCRLGELASIVRGGSPRPAGDNRYYDGNIPFLKVADLTADDNIYLKNHTYTIKKEGLFKTRYVDAETLMLTNSGATLGVPKVCLFPTTFNDGIAALLGLNNIEKIFLYYFLKSKTEWYLKVASRGQGQPNLNTDIISLTVFALPPLNEQKRIITKLEQLVRLCDDLEQSIQQNQKYTQELLQVALKEALEPT